MNFFDPATWIRVKSVDYIDKVAKQVNGIIQNMPEDKVGVWFNCSFASSDYI